jgi:hypothetical protein
MFYTSLCFFVVINVYQMNIQLLFYVTLLLKTNYFKLTRNRTSTFAKKSSTTTYSNFTYNIVISSENHFILNVNPSLVFPP